MWSLVTGAANGIGASLTELAVQKGHQVIATDLDIKGCHSAGKTSRRFAVKPLLVSPSDHERGGGTPFFRRLQDKNPDFLTKLITQRQNTVPDIIASIGLKSEDIDYITYDHLHTQDLRRWLGTDAEPAVFPNAKLLVHLREWASTQDSKATIPSSCIPTRGSESPVKTG